MKKWLVAFLFGALLVLGACGNGENEDATGNEEAAESSEEVDEGDTANDNQAEEADSVDAEELVKSNCASCHSGDFELVAGGSNLPAEEIEDIIKNGVGSMPAIEDVTDEEAKSIANYLAAD